VDFWAGRVTRSHGDIDLAVWATDVESVHGVLTDDGWIHTPPPEADGYTEYRRDGVQLDLAFLARDPDGSVYTPLRDGRADWPSDSLPGDVVELDGSSARVVGLSALIADKSEARDDPSASEKDRVDVAVLTRLS
jgi:hypothetical protein